MKYEEHNLQKRCVDLITYRYSHLVCHHSPNEAKRTPKQGARLKAIGMRAGWPDLEILHDGTVLFVEFKTKKGRQEPEQEQMQALLEGMGYTYLICRDYFDFVEICHKLLGPERDPDIEQLKKILGQ